MNPRSNRDLNTFRRKISGLRALLSFEVSGFRFWLIGLAFSFFFLLIFCILIPDIPHNSFDDWLKLIFVALLGAVVAATFVVFGEWVRRRLTFRRFIVGLACLAALITLFYVEEDWKGNSDLEKFKLQWEAKGENFDRDSLLPKPVPDDQNFAMSPVWIAELKWNDQTEPGPGTAEAWYGNRIYSEEVSNYFRLGPITKAAVVLTNYSWMGPSFPNTPDTLGDWAVARMSDLRPWQSYYRNLWQTNPSAGIAVTPRPQAPAQDVLLALSKYNPLIERLRQDSQLPYSRFPIEYSAANPDMILLPHFDAIRECAEVLELRAIAELQNGQDDKALADVNLMLRLADASRTEPFLMSHLVRIAILQIALQPIYEGLANHEWSDSQLVELDSKLSKFDFLTDFKFSLRGDMIVSLDGFIEYLRRDPGQIFEGPTSLGEGHSTRTSTLVDSAIANLIPTGWYYENELHDNRAIEEFYLPVADTNREIISPTSVRHGEAGAETDIRHVGPYNVLERLSLPALTGVALRVAYGQNAANLARVAIALERYRIAHGGYPDSLTPLEPQFITRLPHDIINGQPLHYHRTANGQFILYSIGWNEKDDGGKVVVFETDHPPSESRSIHSTANHSTELPPRVDRKHGDWVWRYPERTGKY